MDSSPPDDLNAFHSERPSRFGAVKRFLRARRGVVLVCGAALFGGSIAVGYIASTHLQAARSVVPVNPTLGTAIIDSNPPGTVTIEGVVRGETPLSLHLPAGSHTVTIVAGKAARSVLLEIEAGSTTRQYIEFAPPSSPAASTGRLDVSSQPSGARVTVDGAPKGATPLSLGELAEGPHQVLISNGETSIRRSVVIRAGATASVDASLSSPDSSAGWLALTSPVELTLAEDNQIIGTTKAARLMLPVGTHNLVLSNAALEFQTTMAVRIESGKSVDRAVALPTGLLSVNAVPWANVSVDGGDIGTTPLANISLPIGSHEVVWRHPQLGERRRTIVITAKTPMRIGMDFKQ